MRQKCSLIDFSGKKRSYGLFLGSNKICIQTGLAWATDEINHAFAAVITTEMQLYGKYPPTHPHTHTFC